MPRPQTRPKERCSVPIPGELRDALRAVRDLIRQAGRDPDGHSLDFDDAIQVRGTLVGGRVGARERPYVLTYLPPDDAERGLWSLTLHPLEIGDIADGWMTEIVLHCCAGPECRRKFREEEGTCGSCDHAPDPDYAHVSLAEALPRLEGMGIRGLTGSATRGDVLAILGPPGELGGGTKESGLYLKPWFKYHRPDGQLRFECSKGGRVEAVTFLPRDWRPGG